MAFRVASEGLKRNFVSRSELILRNLPRFVESKEFEQKYHDFLKGIKFIRNNDASSFLIFPRKVFNRFPFNSIENVLKSTHKFLKDNNAISNTVTCNNLLRSFITYDVELDAAELFDSMNNNKVLLNELTFTLLLELHCGRGEMDAAEKVVNVMNVQKIPLLPKSYHSLYGGYIRAGRLEDGKKLIEAGKIDVNDSKFLIEKVKAYADIGDFNEVMEHVAIIQKSHPEIPGKICIGLYRRLVKAKATDSELNKIISLVDGKNPNSILESIFHLNRFGFYNYGLKVMLAFPNIFENANVLSDLITSFNNINCPTNIYKSVLEHFSHLVYPTSTLNLFAHMDFDKALKMTEAILTPDNQQCLASNLFMKAIKEKSINNFQEAFKVGLQISNLRNLSIMVQFVVIPSSLELGLFKSADEILDLMPQHHGFLLPIIFMHFLRHGDFASFESLLVDSQSRMQNRMYYLNFSRSNSKSIVANVPFKEIVTVASEAAKVFSPHFVNWLIGSVVGERIVQMSEIDNVTGIEEAIMMAKNLGITFEQRDFLYVQKNVHRHQRLLEGLVVEFGHDDGINESPEAKL